MSKSWTPAFPLVLIPVAVLSGCGGGGGGETPSQPVLSLSVPTAQETGLAPPTDNVKQEPHVAGPIVKEVIESYNRAAGAAALQAAGRLAPGLAQAGSSPARCGGGGTIAWTNPAPSEFAYSYSACQDSGHTFDGNSTASGSATSWTQSYVGLLSGSVAAPLDGSVSCSPPIVGAAARCLVNHDGFDWGFDARFEDGKANGTHRRNDRLSYNVTFSDYSATTGAALVSGVNGTALVTHGATVNDFVISVSLNGTTTVYRITCPRAPESC